MKLALKSGFLGLSLTLLASNCVYAKRGLTHAAATQNGSQNDLRTRAANCSPGTALTRLEFNNVRALLEQGGSMFQDRASGTAAYEWPKTTIGSGDKKRHVIYAGALWMGGKDFNDQLKLAAIQFRQQGNDFWPGPLDTVGTTEITPGVCADYDRFFEIKRQDVF